MKTVSLYVAPKIISTFRMSNLRSLDLLAIELVLHKSQDDGCLAHLTLSKQHNLRLHCGLPYGSSHNDSSACNSTYIIEYYPRDFLC